MAMQDVSLENMLIFVYDKENASSYASKEAPTASTETNDEKKSGSGPAESSISSHEDVIRIKICDPGQAVTFEIDPETGEEKPVAYRGLVGKSFRPPELSQKEPYIASKVDSWCLGWSTFYLLSALPLFLSADSNQKDAEYWNFFRRGDLEGLFRRKSDIDRKLSPTCMDFIMRLMRIVPKQRMSIKESLEHKWLADESVPRSLSTADLETAERKSLQYDRIRNQDHPIAMGVSTGPSFFNSRARSPQMRFQSPLGGRGFTSTVRSRSPLVTNFAPPLRSISPAPAGMISPMQLRPMKKAMPEPQSIGKTQLIHPEKVAAALAQSSSKASGVNADGTFIAEKVEAVLKQTQARSTSVSRIQAPPRTQSFFGSFGRPVRTSTAGGSATSSSGTSGGSASAAAGGSATTSSSQVASASSFSSSVLVGSGGPTLASSVAVGASPATSAVVSGSVSQGSGFRSVPFLGSSASQQGLSTLVQNRSKSNMFATSLGAAGGFGGASLGTSSATASSSLGIGPGGVRKMWPAQTPPVGASNMDVTQLMTKDQLGVAHYHNQQLPPASSSSSATSVGNISVAEEQVPAFIGEASTVVKPVVGTTSGSTSVSVNIPPAPGSLHQQQEQQPNPLVVGGTSNSKEQAIPNPIGATVPGPSSGPALSAAVVASPAPTAVSSASSSLGLHGNRTRSAMSFHFGAGPSQLQGQGSMFLGGQNATCVDLQSGGIAAGAAVAADSGTHGVSTSSGSSSSGKEQAALAARAGGNASCTSGSVLSVGRGGTTGPQPRALSKPPGSTTTTTSTSGFAGPPAPASRGFGMLGSPTIGGPGGSPFLGVQQLHNMPRSPLLDARLSGAGFPGLGVLYQPHPSSPPPPSKKSIASRRSVSTGPAANAHNRGSMAPRQGFAFQRGSPLVHQVGEQQAVYYQEVAYLRRLRRRW
ncbi:unnamed protein product [Amoebophrya sp. A25]|nr:unnamed protein product [Amoebophrya sp. A25]|eukprot:GSA25T00002784001.1